MQISPWSVNVKVSTMKNRKTKSTDRYGYDHTTGEGQKRLMYESIGIDITSPRALPAHYEEGEYGSDPILDENGEPTGKIRMVPTGRVVDLREGKER